MTDKSTPNQGSKNVAALNTLSPTSQAHSVPTNTTTSRYNPDFSNNTFSLQPNPSNPNPAVVQNHAASTPDALAIQVSNVDLQDWQEQKNEIKKQRTVPNPIPYTTDVSMNYGDPSQALPPIIQSQPIQAVQPQPLLQHQPTPHTAIQLPMAQVSPVPVVTLPQQPVQQVVQPPPQIQQIQQTHVPRQMVSSNPVTTPLQQQPIQQTYHRQNTQVSSGPVPTGLNVVSPTPSVQPPPQLQAQIQSQGSPANTLSTQANGTQTASRRRRNPDGGFDHTHVQTVAPPNPAAGYVHWKPKDKLSKAQRDKLSRLIAEANMLQGRHKFVDAIGVFDQVLNIDPNNITALNSKGVCYKYVGDNKHAMACYQRALEIKPDDWTAHNNRGVIFKDAGLFQEAIDCYKYAIQYGADDCIAKTNMAIVLTDLGTTLKLAGSVALAVQKYNEALRYNPDYVAAYFNLGVVYSETGQFDQALKYYMLSVEKNPNYVEALCNIGVIYKNSGKLEEAIQYYQRALMANANFEIANNNIAIAYTDMGTKVKNSGDINNGIRYYKQALLHNSKYADAWYNLGVAYAEKREIADSVICYETAVAWKPKCAEAYNNLGVIYKERGNLQKAVLYYQKALRANPNFAHTLNNLGVIYTMMGKLDEAYAYCHQAIQVNPTYAEAYNNLGVLYRDEGRIREAIKSYEDCLVIDPNSRNAGQNRLLAMNYLYDIDVKEVTEAHREWGIRFSKLYKRFETHDNDLNPDRAIRIGYISPDFFAHSVSYFIEAPLTYHNKDNCHIFCYSNVVKEDYKTEILKKVAHEWRNIHGKTSVQVCNMIRADKIDILVELTGHTAGNRLDVMAHAPCPVQVTWIGYPNSTGLPTIDYRFADSVTDPVDTKQDFIEKLVRFQTAFLCYSPPRNVPEVSEVPAANNKFVTFGSFNNLAKIHTKVLTLWARILGKVPHSRMLMKCKPFASESVKNKVLEAFARFGIAPKRIDLLPLLPSTADHMRAYSMVDIALDTFPYAGTTTTCEAMYMGVPVVTLVGSVHAQNVGVSLLQRAGYDQLIAQNEGEYVKIAVRLATTMDLNGELTDLKELRSGLRQRMLNSPLCDGQPFTEHLEEVYRQIWRTHCNSKNESGVKSETYSSVVIKEESKSMKDTGSVPSS